MIREAFKNYIDADGWVMDSPAGASNNRILDTAEYYMLLALSGELEGNDKLDAYRLFQSCSIVPGLFNRTPPAGTPHGDQQGHDDYIGLAAASLMLGLPFAKDIVAYGKKSLWWFNNEKPGTLQSVKGGINWKAFFGRYPADICHLYICANDPDQPPPYLTRIAWAIALRLSGRGNTDTDARTLSWIMIQAYEKSDFKYPALDSAVKAWKERFAREWPGGMRDVQHVYRADKNHPFGKVAWP